MQSLLLELLQCRNGSLTLPNGNFNTTDIIAMIDILCTSITCARALEVILQFYCLVFSFGLLVAASYAYIVMHFIIMLYFEYK